MNSIIKVLALSTAALVLSGCATPAQQASMVVDTESVSLVNRHAGTVSVEVDGGSDTSAFGTPQVSNDVMQAAVEESVTNSGLFEGGVVAENGDHQLIVTFVNMKQPIFGLTFNVDMEMAWQLHDTDGNSLWRKVIESTGTAGFGDAAVAATRLRIATERSVQANIQESLMILGEQSLEQYQADTDL